MSERLKSTAAALAAARANGHKLAVMPGDALENWEQAHRLQDAVIAATDSPLAGWKIGATSAASQAKLGFDRPFCGPLFERWITNSPAEIATAPHALRLIEPEIAISLAHDLPRQNNDLSDDTIIAAVEALHPAFELVDRRTAVPTDEAGTPLGPLGGNPFWLVADSGANAALVLGAAYTDWQNLDVDAIPVRVSIDEQPRSDGLSDRAMGGPLKALCWLVRHLHDRGYDLRAGDVITTGVISDILVLHPGETADADFGPLGTLSLAMGEYED